MKKLLIIVFLIGFGSSTINSQIFLYSTQLDGKYVNESQNCKRIITVSEHDGLFSGTFEDCNDLREYYVYNSERGDYYVMNRNLQDEAGEYSDVNEISFELIGDKGVVIVFAEYDHESDEPKMIYFRPLHQIDPSDLVEGNYEYVDDYADETYSEDEEFYEEENEYYSVIDVGGAAFLEENDWMNTEFEGTCLEDPISGRRMRIQKVGKRVYGFAYDYLNEEFTPFGYFQWEEGAYMQWKIKSSGEIVIDDDLFEHNKDWSEIFFNRRDFKTVPCE